jgi:hypothetical protein
VRHTKKQQKSRAGLQRVPNINDKSVSDICFRKSFHGSVHIINWNNLNVSCYVVFGSKINHLLCFLHAPNATTTNYLPSCHSIILISTQSLNGNAQAATIRDFTPNSNEEVWKDRKNVNANQQALKPVFRLMQCKGREYINSYMIIFISLSDPLLSIKVTILKCH